MKTIRRIARGKFAVATVGISQELMLDFNPIIERFELTGNFRLIHWQAKPKGSREFGIYDRESDTYRSLVATDRVGYGAIDLLMLDDSDTNTIPSAVILHRGSLR